MNEYLKYGNLSSKTEDSHISGIPLADRLENIRAGYGPFSADALTPHLQRQAEASKQADVKKTLEDLEKAKEVCLEQLYNKEDAQNLRRKFIDGFLKSKEMLFEPSCSELNVKNPIYTAPSGADLIDEFAKNNTPDEFRAVINFNIQKYSKRYGKKDEQLKEARKIADYASRLVAFEEGLLNE